MSLTGIDPCDPHPICTSGSCPKTSQTFGWFDPGSICYLLQLPQPTPLTHSSQRGQSCTQKHHKFPRSLSSKPTGLKIGQLAFYKSECFYKKPLADQKPGLKPHHTIFSFIYVLVLTAPLAELSSHRSMGHMCAEPSV